MVHVQNVLWHEAYLPYVVHVDDDDFDSLTFPSFSGILLFSYSQCTQNFSPGNNTSNKYKMGIVFGKTGVAEPPFVVLLSRSAPIAWELRQYGKRFAIETECSNNSDGFRSLAGYIGVGGTPQNEGAVSIAMTAPVVTESVGQKGGEKIAMTAPVVTSGDNKAEAKKMSFILPDEYDGINKIPPKPTNNKVKVVEVPAAKGAVHTFSGSMNDAKSKSKATEFARQLIEDGVDTSEDDVLRSYELWQFHPPFTLGPLRKNEIWVDLSEKQVDELLKKYKDDKQT